MPHIKGHASSTVKTHARSVMPTAARRPSVLRISITGRCNYHCLYCRPPGVKQTETSSSPPSLSELGSVVAWLCGQISVNRVKLTGGEPLLRRGVSSFVSQLSALPDVAEVTLTTNGSRLAKLARELAEAGLKRVNVSLDTLDPARFRALTGGSLNDVLLGIRMARAAGLVPVKINSVLQRSAWETDVPALIDYAHANDFELRFIELMSAGAAGSWSHSELITADFVKRGLQKLGYVIEQPEANGVSPARMTVLRWGNKLSRVGWIMPHSQPFCDGCNRLRLDSYGQLRRCLMDPVALPLLDLLKCGEAQAAAALTEYLLEKRAPLSMATDESMAFVGG